MICYGQYEKLDNQCEQCNDKYSCRILKEHKDKRKEADNNK